jgi:hypothetical protein
MDPRLRGDDVSEYSTVLRLRFLRDEVFGTPLTNNK